MKPHCKTRGGAFPALLLILAGVLATFGGVQATPMGPEVFDLGGAKPYTLLQLGNNSIGTGGTSQKEGDLNIESNSSVFGSTLKGVDDDGKENKISTSKVTGDWARETGVLNDKTSSFTNPPNPVLTLTEFNAIATDALAASSFWASQTSMSLTSGQIASMDGDGGLTLTGTTGGANVFDFTNGNFNLNGEDLTLTGEAGDFFVFNIPAEREFKVNSGARIVLGGDIEPEEVLFNVLGFVGGGSSDDALIQSGSTFRGTLLAPGRNVLVGQNHFNTFASEGFMDDDGETQAPRTTLLASTVNTPGLFGQIIAGGKINFSESDIAHHPFMTMPPHPVPEPSTWLLLGSGLVGLAFYGWRKRKQAA